MDQEISMETKKCGCGVIISRPFGMGSMGWSRVKNCEECRLNQQQRIKKNWAIKQARKRSKERIESGNLVTRTGSKMNNAGILNLMKGNN
jgi:hypothetical protein